MCCAVDVAQIGLYMDFEQTVIHCCAPVLCGIKPASIFSLCRDTYGSGSEKLNDWKSVFRCRNIFIIPIQKKCGRMLVFVYDRCLLASVLADAAIRLYLTEKGYPVRNGFYAVLDELLFRLMRQAAFPHEIGLFLGYPLEDVIAFVQYRGAFFKHNGYWKVYGDTASALQTMKSYAVCRDYCMKLVVGGMSVPSAAEKYRLFEKELEVQDEKSSCVFNYDR